jgi:hypothetical protein
MTRQQTSERFKKNHQLFLEYIESLSEIEFLQSQDHKWTPGQQLAHVSMCLEPLAQVLQDKQVIESKFGRTKRKSISYNAVITNYKVALEKGGKAPERFVPEEIAWNRREEFMVAIRENVKKIIQSMGNYTDVDLDSLVLPHPLLGNLTIREMLYLMAYHVSHHQESMKESLKAL